MSLWDKLDQAGSNEKKEFKMLPEGNYQAEITDIQIKEEFDAVSFSVEFTILEGEFKGRKTWFSQKIDENTSDKKLSFIKGQICQMTNTQSTKGDVTGTLLSARGNIVDVAITHTQGVKDPSKTYVNTYCNGVVRSGSGEF